MADDSQNDSHQIDTLVAEAKVIEADALAASQRHLKSAHVWKWCHYVIGLPTAVLAALAGVSALSDHAVIGAFLAIAVAASTAVQTFLNPNDRADQRRKIGNAFKAINNDARIFHQVQCQAPTNYEELRDALKVLNERRNTLLMESP